MSFYVTLPSNSSVAAFPDNTISDFRTKLASHINLGSIRHEVAVTEICFPTEVLQFPKKYELGWILLTNRITEEKIKLFLTKESFKTIQELVDDINDVVHTVLPNRSDFVLLYEEGTQRIGLSVNENEFFIKFSEKLKSVLGLAEEINNIVFLHTYHGKYPVDLRAGNYMGYLYSDVIQPQIVGDNVIQLLRVFPLGAGDSKITSIVFQYPYYKSLNTNEFDSIHVFLRNEVGEKIVFNSGILTVTLHFREIK
jgi:hypothetical protein